MNTTAHEDLHWRTVDTYLSGHRRQVPNTADNGPAGHHSQQVCHHPVLAAVPEGVTKLRVILQKERRLDVRTIPVLGEGPQGQGSS